MYLITVTTAVLMLFSIVDAKLAPTIRLNNGYEMPVIGLGTFESTSGDAERAVKDAIDAGYRHIDTAFLYGNEVEVGNAVRAKIAEGIIKREDIFITTKLWSTFHEPEQVEKAFQRSFDNLNLGYIDLYLIHYPVAYRRVLQNIRLPPDDVNAFHVFPVDKDGKRIRCIVQIFSINPSAVYHLTQFLEKLLLNTTKTQCKTLTADVDYLDTWRAMEKLVESGRVRSIGISNFNSEQTERILLNGKIKPVTNQVECHPNLNQRKLIEFSAAKNITITAYSPLGRPHTPSGRKLAISDPKVLEMAQKYRKTPAQIILRYTVQNGAIVIPKSTNLNRIKENFNIFDFTISDADMRIMHGLNDNYRLIDFGSDKDNKYYPFNIEF